MNTCTQCRQVLPLDQFYRNGVDSKGNARYRSSCKNCKNASDKRVYDVEKSRQWASLIMRRKRAVVNNYLLTHPCIDCGEADPVVLEFDHVKGTKVKAVSQMVANKAPDNLIIKEIEKCEVRCANCHRRVTAKRGKWHNA